MEIYNSFSSNYLDYKINYDLDCILNFKLNYKKNFSSSFTENYYKFKKQRSNTNCAFEKAEKKEILTKTKSITCINRRVKKSFEFIYQGFNIKKGNGDIIKKKNCDNFNDAFDYQNKGKFFESSNFNLIFDELNDDLNSNLNPCVNENRTKQNLLLENEKKFKNTKDIQNHKFNKIIYEKNINENFIKSNKQNSNKININAGINTCNLKFEKGFIRTIEEFDSRNKSIQKSKGVIIRENKDQEISEDLKDQIEKFLLTKILKNRVESVKKIIKRFRIFKENQKIKYEILKTQILSEREKSAIKIQTIFRSFFVRKCINNILAKLEKNYIFTYDNNKNFFEKTNNNINCLLNNAYISNANYDIIDKEEESLPNDIKLKIINKKSNNPEILNFEYSKILKIYYVVFKKSGLVRKNHKVNFIVNGKNIIDPRYKLCSDENGKYYNIIESHMQLIKNKIKTCENQLEYLYLKKSNSESDKFNDFKSIEFTCNSERKKDLKFITEEKNNYWEDIFKIKFLNNQKCKKSNSLSDASETADLEKIFTRKSYQNNLNNKNLHCGNTQIYTKKDSRPCLKKQFSHDKFNKKKTVNFNENVKIFFFPI